MRAHTHAIDLKMKQNLVYYSDSDCMASAAANYTKWKSKRKNEELKEKKHEARKGR